MFALFLLMRRRPSSAPRPCSLCRCATLVRADARAAVARARRAAAAAGRQTVRLPNFSSFPRRQESIFGHAINAIARELDPRLRGDDECEGKIGKAHV